MPQQVKVCGKCSVSEKYVPVVKKIQWLSQKSAISPFRNSEITTKTAKISCFGCSNRTDISVSHLRCVQITAKALLKSLCLPVCVNTDKSRYPKRIFIKFRIGESYKILSSYLNFHWNLTLLTLTLHGDLHAFLRERPNTCICPFRKERAFALSDANRAFQVFVIPVTLYYSTSALTQETHGLRAVPELERSECIHLLICPLPQKKAVKFHFVITFLKCFLFQS